MNNIMPNGTEVLIFKNTDNKNQEMNFIKGMVIGSYEENEKIDSENTITIRHYNVYGEDGEEYNATKNYAHKGNFYIRTIDEYIEYLRNTLFNNNKKIIELNHLNKQISEILSHLSNYKKNSKKR